MTSAYVDPSTLHNPAATNVPTPAWGVGVNNALNFLAGPPCARVIRTTTLSVPNATLVKPSYASAEWDTDSFWSAGSPTRLTVPAAHPGIYLIGANALWDGVYTASLGGWRQLRILQGGATVVSDEVGSRTRPYMRMQTWAEVRVTAPPMYFEVDVYQNTGLPSSIGTANQENLWFSIRWLGRI